MNNLRTTKCIKCGIEITGKSMQPPFIKPEKLGIDNVTNFYGGRIQKFITAVCCGVEYIAFLHAEGNSYKVVDLALKDTVTSNTYAVTYIDPKIEPDTNQVVLLPFEPPELPVTTVSDSSYTYTVVHTTDDSNILISRTPEQKEQADIEANKNVTENTIQPIEDDTPLTAHEIKQLNYADLREYAKEIGVAVRGNAPKQEMLKAVLVKRGFK
jgi:hypothetical protein